MDLLRKAGSLLSSSLDGANNTEDDLKAIVHTSDQSDDEKKIVAWIKGKADESRQNPSRVAFEMQALTNTAYLLGYDSVVFDSKTRNMRPLNGAATGFPLKSRAHANLILPSVQNRLARLLQNPPKFDVIPNTNSTEDKDAARLTQKVIVNVQTKENYDEKRIERTMWQQQAGHAWGKVGWDPTKGNRLPDVGDGEVHHEGDICLEVCSPLEIFADPLAKSYDEMQWLIQAKVRKLSYFQNQYPKRGHLVKQEGAWLLSIQNLFKINNMNSKGSWGSNQVSGMENAAIELAYFEKPSKRYPSGRMIITANGVLLEYKELPVGKIPFVKFDDVKIGGKFYSESLITHMRPLQDQYNRNLRRSAEFANRGLALKFMAAKGHGLSPESINDTTEVYQYNAVPGATPPTPITPPQLPQYVFSQNDSLKAQFGEIIGISEPSKGQMPSASIPAIGMQLLVESDQTRIGIVTNSNENSEALIGELIARYASKFYQTKRFIKEAGEDGEYNFTEFVGADLRESFDVKVLKGSTLPGSKVLKRQEVINLYERGYLGDPQDPVLRQKILGALEYGELSQAWEDLRIDLQQIKRTIKEMEQMQEPEFHPDDNHPLHFNYKNRHRKTEKFLSYTPEVQALFLQDLENHKLAMMPPMPPMPPGAEGGEMISADAPPMEEALAGMPENIDSLAMGSKPEVDPTLMNMDEGLLNNLIQ